MPIDDHPIIVALREFKEAYSPSTDSLASAVAQSTILSLLPGIGAAVEKVTGEKEKVELVERLHSLFGYMLEYIEEHPGRLQAPDYYRSLQFREAMQLSLESLLSSRDEQKLSLLGRALVNSGAEGIAPVDEQAHMLRALRDLSPSDIRLLGDWRLKGWTPLIRRIEYGPDVLSGLHRLASFGFVIDHHQKPNPNIPDDAKLAQFLKYGQIRTFKIAPFGERFLAFLAEQSSIEPAVLTRWLKYHGHSTQKAVQIDLADGVPTC